MRVERLCRSARHYPVSADWLTEELEKIAQRIPLIRRPTLAKTIKNTVYVPGTVGLGLVVSTIISDYLTGTATEVHLGVLGQLAGYVIAVVLDISLFVMAFRVLTAREVPTRDVLPGAALRRRLLGAPAAVVADHLPAPALHGEHLRQRRRRDHVALVVLPGIFSLLPLVPFLYVLTGGDLW